MPDVTLVCETCQSEFSFTASEQDFYASKNLSQPRRCRSCKDIRRQERHESHQMQKMHVAVCSQCGTECQVPFLPRPTEEGGRPILCRLCFMASRVDGA